MSEGAIADLLREERIFPPHPDFTARANAAPGIRERAAADPVVYWAEAALERVAWFREPTIMLDDSDPPFYKWFTDGELNISYNCLDRHLEAGHGERTAFFWEGEPGEERVITYRELYEEVCRFANGLRHSGVKKGDRVAVYMGMVPELAVAMLACARIGAAHSVIFGGFSSDAIADRVEDAGAEVLITCDGAWRRGRVVDLKGAADVAMERTDRIRTCIVLRRTAQPVMMREGRDVWWHDLVEGQAAECPPEVMGAEDLLYILYTSGTTAKPKGIMHTTGGYLVGAAATHSLVFDLKPDEDVWWCAADIGWVTGHTYIVYGPLANRATSVMYEGTPDFPERDRLWAIVAKYGVTQLYTAPTAIRAFMKWGEEFPRRHDLSSLRLLGTVGEPINPEAWMWYHEHIGGGRAPIVDTWWQTETGSIMISPLPGITATKPGSATHPMPGIAAGVVDDDGNEVREGGGYLVVKGPWPSMLRSIWGDDQRYIDTYWSRFAGMYFPGDGAKLDEDGYFWLLGRVDDVMLVAGHNISTMEVESALVSHPAVAEAAVVGRSDPLTGQAIAAFVSLRGGVEGNAALLAELREHVASSIGPIAKPKSIVFTPDVPKTRSGKIMRRLLRDISEQRSLGDVTTLANADIVAEIAEKAAAAPPED